MYDAGGKRVRKVTETLLAGGLQVTDVRYFEGCEIKRISLAANVQLMRATSHIADETGRIALIYRWSQDSGGLETADVSKASFRYQLTNHLGSSCLELNESAAVITYEEYFPFGGSSFIAGDDAKDVSIKTHRFCGKERDEFTGFYYFGFRYYASWLGRWISPDPIGPKDDLNLYRYVRNNPVSLYDQDGLQAQSATFEGFVPYDDIPAEFGQVSKTERFTWATTTDKGVEFKVAHSAKEFVAYVKAHHGHIFVYDPLVQSFYDSQREQGKGEKRAMKSAQELLQLLQDVRDTTDELLEHDSGAGGAGTGGDAKTGSDEGNGSGKFGSGADGNGGGASGANGTAADSKGTGSTGDAGNSDSHGADGSSTEKTGPPTSGQSDANKSGSPGTGKDTGKGSDDGSEKGNRKGGGKAGGKGRGSGHRGADNPLSDLYSLIGGAKGGTRDGLPGGTGSGSGSHASGGSPNGFAGSQKGGSGTSQSGANGNAQSGNGKGRGEHPNSGAPNNAGGRGSGQNPGATGDPNRQGSGGQGGGGHDTNPNTGASGAWERTLQILGYTNLDFGSDSGGAKSGGIPGGAGSHKSFLGQVLYAVCAIVNLVMMVKSIIQSVAKGALGRIMSVLSSPRAWLASAERFFLRELPTAVRKISWKNTVGTLKALFNETRQWKSVASWRNYKSFLFKPRWFGTLERVGQKSLYTWEHFFPQKLLQTHPRLGWFINSYANTWLRLPLETNSSLGAWGVRKVVFYYGAARAVVKSWQLGWWVGNKAIEEPSPRTAAP